MNQVEGHIDYSQRTVITLVLPCLFPLSGAERLALARGEHLIQLGYNVQYVFVNEPGDFASVLPVGAMGFNLGAKRLRDAIFPLRRYLIEHQPDVVEAAMWALTSVAVIAHRLARSNSRLVLSDHSILSMQYGQRSFFYRAAMRAVMSICYRLAHARIAVSHDVAVDTAKLAFMQASQFDVVHNPVSINICGSQDVFDAESAWNGWSGKRILTVGRLKAVKNHAMLVYAFKKFLEKQDARLMIVGSGELEEELCQLIASENLEDNILLPGNVDDPAPYYRSADLFVLSSDYEGFGNVLVEAMALGTAIVSTDCPGGPHEILDGGKFGILTPVGDSEKFSDSMLTALMKEKEPEKLKQRAADFSIETTTELYLEVLFPASHSNRAAALFSRDDGKSRI